MPGTTLPEVDHFIPVEPTKEAVDFIKLIQIDLSRYDEGDDARQDLAEQVRQAMTTQGFFTLVGHGINEETIERQVDIGHTILKRTSQEDKFKFQAPIREEGTYFGFKPRGLWVTSGKERDRIENFGVYRRLQHEYPAAFQPYRDEARAFANTMHRDILYKILRLFAIALRIEDEDYFVKLHSYEGDDISWLRWMEYYSDEEDKKSDVDDRALWLFGHRDFTSLSLLFSQPMTSLQVRDVNDHDEWKYVPHTPSAMIVNAGEIMQWFTGGYFKAAIHRVVSPPSDQRGHLRSGAYYFSVPNNDVVINTLLEQSPVLREAGVEMAHKPEDAPTSLQWCTARVQITGKGDAFREKGSAEGNRVEEKVGKVTTTWFR